MFLFTDPRRFHPSVQNHCYSIKLKAIWACIGIMCTIFNFIGSSIFIGNRVKKDLLIIYIVKYEGVHSNLAMTVCSLVGTN